MYVCIVEESLYETTAHDKVLDKEVLTDRLRPYLWKESMSLTDNTEDLLIAKLLLEDEKEVIESDRLLEQDDIGKVDSILKGQFVLIFECPLRILYVFD